MDSPGLTNGDSAAEKSKIPDRKETYEPKSPGELIQANNTMVTIYVGPAKVKWVLHEAMICNESPFFKGAFQSDFAEGSSKTTHLEEDDPKAFKLFVDYLYNSQARCCLTHDGSPEAHDHIKQYFKLEVFADKIGSEELSEWAFDEYYHCIRSEWTTADCRGYRS